ncbi:hypothetical protein ACOQ1T_000785 [Escherichia coli]|nr:hypothetical protein [Escherichia coli]
MEMTENELRTFLNVSDDYPSDNDQLDEFLESEGLSDVVDVDNLGDVLGIDPDWMESLTTFPPMEEKPVKADDFAQSLLPYTIDSL